MGVALSIVFSGLCAFVDNGSHGAGQVLLVDGRGVREVGGLVLPRHAPALVVALQDLANADTSSPTRVVIGPDGAASSPAVGQIGIWDLSGSEVRVRVQGREPVPVEIYRPAEGASSWPNPPRDANDGQSWRDIRFVASINRLAGGGRLRPSLTSTETLPRGVAGRVILDRGRVEAGLPSEERYRSELFEFRGARGEPLLKQALTDTVRWNIEGAGRTITLEIVAVAGGETRRLVFAPSTIGRTAYISNLPAHNRLDGPHHGHAANDAEVVARHFGAYYELLEHVPADPPLPRAAGPERAAKGAGLVRPLICTPALFEQ